MVKVCCTLHAKTKAQGSKFIKMVFFAAQVNWQENYSMPQSVGHASFGNLEVLHQKANDSTIAFTHCEQENEIT